MQRKITVNNSVYISADTNACPCACVYVCVYVLRLLQYSAFLFSTCAEIMLFRKLIFRGYVYV